MTEIIITKTCQKCKIVKNLTEFHQTKRLNDGRESYCKDCKNQIKRIKSKEPLIYPDSKTLEKFWSNVEKTDYCWLWKGRTEINGYGLFSIQYRMVLANRYSYFIEHGKLPDNYACHDCDNPTCVNPSHIYDGTQTDNMRDMVNRNRSRKGQYHTQSRLNDEKVSEIKNLLKNNISQTKIAKLFNVNQSSISDIKSGKTWKHI